MHVRPLQVLFSTGREGVRPSRGSARTPVQRAAAISSVARSFLLNWRPPRALDLEPPPGQAPYPAAGPIELLILQGSPFCNIDCGYCYLPNREQRDRMSEEILDAAFARLFESPLFSGRATVVWHAGEPLALPLAFYRRAYALMRARQPRGTDVTWNFQTNAMLLSAEYADFIIDINARVVVSIDGPEVLHDANRVTRSGKGTFAATMRGIEQLRRRRKEFSCIAVLTDRSLEFPDEIYEFFRGIECAHVGFNIDEQDGVRTTSSVAKTSPARYRDFMMRFWDLCRRDGVSPRWVREWNGALQIAAMGGTLPPGRLAEQQEARPFAIVSVDWQGNFMTFSPELLGLTLPRYGDMLLGNVLTTPFDDEAVSARLGAIQSDIRAGIDACRQSCEYFAFCGGGSPGNKIGEHGTAGATETTFCRFTVKAMTEAALGALEREPAAFRR